MTLTGGSSIISRLSGVSLVELVAILRHRAASNDRTQPCVAVDVSWLGYRWSKRAAGPVGRILSFASILCKEGVKVVLVADGTARSDVKRASVHRETQRRFKREAGKQAMSDLIHARSRLTNADYNGAGERAALEDEIKALDEYVLKSGRSGVTIPSNFYDQLQSSLPRVQLGSRGGSVELVRAEHQADYGISAMAIAGVVDLVVGNDGDYHTLIGDSSLSLADFKLERGDQSLKDAVLTSGNFGTVSEVAVLINLDPAAEAAKDKSDESKRCVEAVYPLLKGRSAEVRALTAVALGSDVYPKAIGSISTPARLATVLVKDGEGYDQLLASLAGQCALSTCVLQVYVDAILYEPSNLEGQPRSYLNGPPSRSLPKYLGDFAPIGAATVDGPAVGTCPGPGDGCNHRYLGAEGSVICSICSIQYCKTCVVDKNFVGNVVRKATGQELLPASLVCLGCFGGNTVLPEYGNVSVSEMMTALSVVAGNVGKEESLKKASADEIASLYQKYVVDKAAELCPNEVAQVKMPLFSSKRLSSTGPSPLSTILSDDFSSLAAFVQDETVAATDLVKIFDLMAAFVRLDARATDDPVRNKYSKVVSKYVMDLANEMRVDSGGRLISRSARHWKDSRFGSLWDSSFRLFRMEDSSVGIWITHSVSASFKSDMYTTEAAFTADALVACTCSCGAGAEKKDGHDRHADVHVLPLAMAMKDLLSDPERPYAESLLVSLAARWSAEDEQAISDNERRVMKASMAALSDAIPGSNSNFRDESASVLAMLDAYSVGTEREKAPPPPPNASDLGPLRKFKYVSNSKTQSCYCCEDAEAEDTVADASTCTSNIIPKYDDIFFATKAICGTCSSSDSSPVSSCIGSKLVDHRRPAISSKIANAALSEAKGEFKAFVDCCGERSRCRVADEEECEDVVADSSQPSAKKRRGADEVQEDARRCHFGAGSALHCTDLCYSGSGYVPVPPPHAKKKLPVHSPSEVEGWNTKKRDRENSKRETEGRKRFVRAEWMRRAAISNDHSQIKRLRICSHHPMEMMSLSYSWIDVLGKQRSSTVTAYFPAAVGRKSVRVTNLSTSASGGLGLDRRAARDLTEADDERKALQQYHAISTIGSGEALEDALGLMNERVRKAAGLDVHLDGHKSVVREIAGRKRPRQDNANAPSGESGDGNPPSPIVHPLRTSDKEVKRCTGFNSTASLLSYVAVVCDGDFDAMKRTRSQMTAFEEWYLYFEIVWGKSCARWVDFESKYRVSARTIVRVFLDKLGLVLDARRRWPTYVSMEEDETLRDDKWNERYDGLRIVFWDGTNADMDKPANPDLQRLTHSRYYGGNVGKGGVFLQLCGWGGVGELWTGAISDTDYMNRSGILKEQEEFVLESSRPEVPFTNILDKGYRLALAALRAGNQSVLQPFWKRSDRKFTSKELLMSAAVAADRAGNERQVNVAKRSGFIQRGIRKQQSMAVFSDVWLAWSFQTNFMYKSVM